MITYLLGIILLIEAALMVFPIIVALCYKESILPFVLTMAIAVALAVVPLIFKPKNRRIYAKDGFITVAIGWILLSALGALPFVFSGVIPNYVDAFFESVSGFTTTGASIMTSIEGSGYAVLFWRSFTHWIGGMGVLVFMLAILPSAGGQAIHLMRAEVPGPTKEKLVPKMKNTAVILYGIYIALTVIQIAALMICRLSFYDSVVTTFATAGTGGFSVLNSSIAGYNNPAAEWVIAVFMFLFGVNFNLYFYIIVGKIRYVLKSEEFRVYALLCALSTALITVNTLKMFNGISDAVRAAFFQVTTIMSTTGFATVNFDMWPEFSKAILVLLMIIGACAGSTAGGLKVSRVIILIKSSIGEIKQMMRSGSVNVVRLDGEPVERETVKKAKTHLTIYALISALSILLISIDNFSFTTNTTAVIACINNIGPGLDVVGPIGNYAGYSMFSKLILSANMLIGRLEIMPMMVLLASVFGKRR